MDTLEAFRARRSIRHFTGEPVSRADLETIVDAGRLAATGSNRQPWDFVVVTRPETIRQFKPAGGWMENAGAVIAVIMDPASRWWVEDGAAAVQNMLLACTALGYGACWREGYSLRNEAIIRDVLAIPPQRKLFTLIAIGIPAETPHVEKKALAGLLHWERYPGS